MGKVCESSLLPFMTVRSTMHGVMPRADITLYNKE
jgi:hypothetical protein